jgi:hypothetical protein
LTLKKPCDTFRLGMITGFNTDVHHGGRLYHVQTEDRGLDHPILESLVYIGGTVVAKKSTPYSEKIGQGPTDEIIASLLKRQHQVIIAAIKAGRIEELILNLGDKKDLHEAASGAVSRPEERTPAPVKVSQPVTPVPYAAPIGPGPERTPPPGVPERAATPAAPRPSQPRTTDKRVSEPVSQTLPQGSGSSGKIGLNLDAVISDYLKRSSEQGKLDLKVVSPSVFIAGKTVALKVQVSRGQAPEPEAVVTVKVIGTAFKPQVFLSRADRAGNASFNFTLPSFTAGTAALVLEAQSSRGRGELKHLIRRA